MKMVGEVPLNVAKYLNYYKVMILKVWEEQDSNEPRYIVGTLDTNLQPTTKVRNQLFVIYKIFDSVRRPGILSS